jgi:hypothetical protein
MSLTLSNVYQQKEVLLLIDSVLQRSEADNESSTRDGADQHHDVARWRIFFLGLVANDWS